MELARELPLNSEFFLDQRNSNSKQKNSKDKHRKVCTYMVIKETVMHVVSLTAKLELLYNLFRNWTCINQCTPVDHVQSK